MKKSRIKKIDVNSSYQTIEQSEQLTRDDQKMMESMGWKQIHYDVNNGVYIYTFKKKFEY